MNERVRKREKESVWVKERENQREDGEERRKKKKERTEDISVSGK